jgi:hypothetical protein
MMLGKATACVVDVITQLGQCHVRMRGQKDIKGGKRKSLITSALACSRAVQKTALLQPGKYLSWVELATSVCLLVASEAAPLLRPVFTTLQNGENMHLLKK